MHNVLIGRQFYSRSGGLHREDSGTGGGRDAVRTLEKSESDYAEIVLDRTIYLDDRESPQVPASIRDEDDDVLEEPRRCDTGPFLERALVCLSLIYLIIFIAAIVSYKAAFVGIILHDPYFATYGLVVTTYILSRFFLSLFHRPPPLSGYEPSIAVIVPAFNEEAAVADTIKAILRLDYPSDLVEVVVINDGSSDSTLQRMEAVAATDKRVSVIDFKQNRGKRAAMAAGVRATSADIVAFVDSDSVLAPDALRAGASSFVRDEIGAVAGHAEVLNVHESWLTRMQTVRYFVAFRVFKAAESLFGAVTCCSGCFALYRRRAILPHMDAWEGQRFLGRQATFGDDRSLTNFVLRNWRVIYEPRAVSYTIVPASLKKFLLQQLRWKRSWTRESLIVSRFVWRKHLVASVATYVGIILPLLAPVTVIRALWWQPLVAGAGSPLLYLGGIYAMAVVYGLYFSIKNGSHNGLWFFGVAFVFFYLVFLVWQTYYAVVTSWKTDWGTRKVAL